MGDLSPALSAQRSRDAEEPGALIALARIRGGAAGQPAALPGVSLIEVDRVCAVDVP
jgi:hypothetical protein